jgi:hypothetical protein
VAGSNALDFQVLGGIAGQLEHLCVCVCVCVCVRVNKVESTREVCVTEKES